MRKKCALKSPTYGIFKLFLLLFSIGLVECHQEFLDQEWTREFAVESKNLDNAEAELIVSSKGFTMIRSIPELNVHHVSHSSACTDSHRCKRHAQDLVDLLSKTDGVDRVEQLFILKRDKRYPFGLWERMDHERARESLARSENYDESDLKYQREVIKRHNRLKFDYNDPMFQYQWHLDNWGQIVNTGLDLNLLPCWRKGYQGQGSRVTVVDDGVDSKHEDLRNAYDPYLSADLNDPTDEHGNPRGPAKVQPERDGHGTSCAGEIAAMADNNKCGVGVAHKVRLGGIRILAGKVTDLMEAYAVLHMHNETDIYSCSWGPSDTGKVMEMPHRYTGRAIHISASRGRGGLGSIFSFASGNGGLRGDNCGADGYVNSPYTFPMAATNIYGQTVFYGERCSAIIAAAPVGGRTASDEPSPKHSVRARIITDAVNSGCKDSFIGTSAATPLGSGCFALILQANRNLTWRDVQHVISHSARIPNDKELVWQKNGAGFHVSHHFGFGLLDCSTGVKVAQSWENVGPRESCSIQIFKGKDPIFAKRSRRYVIWLKNCTSGNSSVGSIEHVTMALKIDHVLRGDIEIWLISPAGTVSRLLGARWPDKSKDGIDFIFLTRFLLGESPKGKWVLEIVDNGKRRTKARMRGAVRLANMTIYGTKNVPAKMAGVRLGKSNKLTSKELKEAYNEGRNRALMTLPTHRDVLELKKQLKKGIIDKNIVKRVKELSRNENVSTEELRDIIELVKKTEKKKTEKKYENEEELLDEADDTQDI